jgi:murein DD-endopeptidase MepM/ murein hydrolase activator NlpD
VRTEDKSSVVDKSESFTISYIENIPSQAPVDGFLTQRMLDESHFWQKNHYGIDIAVIEGEPILAAASGRIIFSGWTYDLGNLIIIYHGDDYFTHYGHNQLNLFKNHGIVKRGDVIALAGSTGISSGPHLHFEIWKSGNVIDPLVFFPEYKERDISIEENG